MAQAAILSARPGQYRGRHDSRAAGKAALPVLK
jgi:hypothetical protein